MLVAAAILPHPPVMLPALAGEAASELDELRQACATAIARLLASTPDVLLVVGGAAEDGTFDVGAVGSFAGFGRDVAVRLPGNAGDTSGTQTADVTHRELPLSLAVAAYLLEETSAATTVRCEAVDQHTSSSKAQYLGAELADSFSRVAMLVLGDGSACLDARAPGYVVDGAREWQQRVDAAFAAADFEVLAQLTEADADRFWVAGRAAWQVLAGAVTSEPAGEAQQARSSQWAPAIHYAGAPYGVQYLVASFSRTGKA